MHEVLATVAANTESITKTVTASALELIKDKNFAPKMSLTRASRSELLKAALASHVNNEEGVSRDHLKTALMAFAAASEDALVTPAEIINSVSDMSAEDLTARVEFAKSNKSMNERLASRARKEFFGSARFASVVDIAENTIGWLADYAIEYGQSSQAIAEAAALTVENPKVASNLVSKLIKTAKVTITDERIITKRISATCEELGLDPKSEDFEAQFREKAIALLQESGYTVDPNTFSLNEVNVSADGFVSASVTSRFTKSVDAVAEMSMPLAEGTDVAENPENLGPIGQAEEVATEGAQEMRAAKRKQILQRIAQMVPGMAAPAPAAAPMGAPAGADLAGGGLGALTMSDEEAASADTDTDAMPEPGTKLPIGSICPQCGSKNVDLANGTGHCNDCNTDMEIKYQITIMPSSDTENDKKNTEAPIEAAPEAPLGGETGLGAATAPAPAAPADAAAMGAPAAPGMPGAGMTPMAKSTPPVMVRISWKQDPEVFIRAAQADFDPKSEAELPVGHICPSCGNREAKKVKSTRFCYDCGEVYIPRIHRSADKTKVEVSIDKIV